MSSDLEKKLNLSKDGGSGVFYTIQGEGKYTGHPTIFIRTSGCTLKCQWKNDDGSYTKCDAWHTSWEPEKNERNIKDIIDQIKIYPKTTICITGGECFKQSNIVTLINDLVEDGYFVTIETNGTVYLENNAQFISLSPKLSSSNNPERKRINPDAIREFITKHNYQCKFVINDNQDIKEALDFKEKFSIPNDKIYLMPQGIEEELLKIRSQWVVELCKTHNFIFCERLQIRLFGNKKGT